MQVREHVDVRLLHHVLDIRFVLQDRTDHPVDALIVTTHQDLEQRAFARAHPPDDLRIRQRRGQLHRRGRPVWRECFHAY